MNEPYVSQTWHERADWCCLEGQERLNWTLWAMGSNYKDVIKKLIRFGIRSPILATNIDQHPIKLYLEKAGFPFPQLVNFDFAPFCTCLPVQAHPTPPPIQEVFRKVSNIRSNWEALTIIVPTRGIDWSHPLTGIGAAHPNSNPITSPDPDCEVKE